MGEARQEDGESGLHLLPAWFVERMAQDDFSFGLMLITGQTMVIETIYDVRQAADGSLWIEVKLREHARRLNKTDGHFYAPTSRTRASVNAAHIIAAYELADT